MSSRLIFRNYSSPVKTRVRGTTQSSLQQHPRCCTLYHSSRASDLGSIWHGLVSGSDTIDPTARLILTNASKRFSVRDNLASHPSPSLAGLARPFSSAARQPLHSSRYSNPLPRTPVLLSTVHTPTKINTATRQTYSSVSPSDPIPNPALWQFPTSSRNATSGTSTAELSLAGRIPLPLPIALKVFKPSPSIPKLSSNTATGTTQPTPQLSFPPPPAILGSRPLYFLAKRFPILAEQELQSMPKRTALDYSSFIIGAMSPPYPSATTIRAVLRQFRMFLKESTQRQPSSTTKEKPVMEQPRTRIWTQAIRGMIWLKQHRRARVAIHTMQKLGIRPTGYAWRSICRGWIEQGELDQAEALALKVFTRPEISHDYQLEERPYYLTDMQTDNVTSPGGSTGGSQARSRLRRSPMSPNSAPLFLVVEALAECGEMERARQLFDMIPEHEMTDLLTSDMVAGYLRVGQQNKAQEVIRVMARCGVKPTAIVFNPIVEHATKHISMEAAEELVEDMTKLGLYLNLFTYKILVQGYLSAGRGDKAIECVNRLRASGLDPDRALGRILLNGLWNLGAPQRGDYGPSTVCEINRTAEPQDAVRLMDEELMTGPDWSHRCMEWIQVGQFELAEETLHLALNLQDSKVDADTVLLIKAFADRNEMRRARHWFEQFSARLTGGAGADDEIAVDLMNYMVSGYIQARQPRAAEEVIGIMSQRGIQPTAQTINLILRWSTVEASMADAEALVQRMTQSGIQPDAQTFEILCAGYAARGSTESLQTCLIRMEEAGISSNVYSPVLSELVQDLLGPQYSHKDEQKRQQPPTILAEPWPVSETTSSNALATLCSRWIEHAQLLKAEDFVQRLGENNHVPKSKIPYRTLIQGWIQQSQQNNLSHSVLGPKSLSTSSESETPDSTSIGLTSSSVQNSKSLDREQQLLKESINSMRRARHWFEMVPESEQTLDMFNDMVGGYMALGLEHESDEMIQSMAARKIKPDVHTYNHILEYTARKLDMFAAESLLERMQRGGIEPDTTTWNALIRGYVIRGQLAQALVCLGRMTGKDLAAPPIPSRIYKSKKKEAIASYDQEILEAVVQQDEDSSTSLEAKQQQQQGRSSSRRESSSPPKPFMSQLEPDFVTEQLLLAGFGPEVNPMQGQGDYGRALELYRSRVARQDHQEQQLIKKLESWTSRDKSVENDDNDEDWILDHLDALQELGQSESELGMTDVDWKNELKWEEMMEVEKARERELSGRG
ncbi:hypothetical protein BGZ83_009980 [Gryganskiella cystojenkinii]|nr:hypothetical protein BGZ83_009980 [Gryganskiella cystojenkinii]